VTGPVPGASTFRTGNPWCAVWNQPLSRPHRPDRQVRKPPDAYLSVVEALRHGGYAHGAKVQLDWVQAEEVEGLMAKAASGTSTA